MAIGTDYNQRLENDLLHVFHLTHPDLIFWLYWPSFITNTLRAKKTQPRRDCNLCLPDDPAFSSLIALNANGKSGPDGGI